MSAETGLKVDMAEFNRLLNETRRMLGRNGGRYVRTTARRLIGRLAWNTPKAPPRYGAAGRLRAGFWPAAQALSIRNIGTRQPNRNEGSAIDRTGAANPSFTIVNSVPYLRNLKDYSWVDTAKQAAQLQMARDLRKYVEKSWRRQELIENLTTE